MQRGGLRFLVSVETDGREIKLEETHKLDGDSHLIKGSLLSKAGVDKNSRVSRAREEVDVPQRRLLSCRPLASQIQERDTPKRSDGHDRGGS
jgi:hypothetical protein